MCVGTRGATNDIEDTREREIVNIQKSTVRRTLVARCARRSGNFQPGRRKKAFGQIDPYRP